MTLQAYTTLAGLKVKVHCLGMFNLALQETISH